MKPGDLVRIPRNINGDPEMIGFVVSLHTTRVYDDYDGEHTVDFARIIVQDSIIENYTPWNLETL